jgi:hypothetical protein
MRNQEDAPMSVVDQSNCSGTQSPSEIEVLRQLRSLRFGQITAMIHDGRIVQIDRIERLRLSNRKDQNKSP